MSRFINGFLDLITIWFLSTFGKRPMHLFGLLGSIMFIIGFLFAFYLGIDKLFIKGSLNLARVLPTESSAASSVNRYQPHIKAGFPTTFEYERQTHESTKTNESNFYYFETYFCCETHFKKM